MSLTKLSVLLLAGNQPELLFTFFWALKVFSKLSGSIASTCYCEGSSSSQSGKDNHRLTIMYLTQPIPVFLNQRYSLGNVSRVFSLALPVQGVYLDCLFTWTLPKLVACARGPGTFLLKWISGGGFGWKRIFLLNNDAEDLGRSHHLDNVRRIPCP